MSSLLDLTKEELVAIIMELRQRVVVLEAEVARLRKNSSNSSKPPSSDIVKPPKPSLSSGRKKRRIGGQLGHPRHERPAFSPDQIDRTRDYELDRCPDCGGRLKRLALDMACQGLAGEDRVIQQVEIVRQPVTINEHRAGSYRCTHCGKTEHKNNGKGWWTWCFRAELFTLFKIDSSRGSDVLLKVLGEQFDGVLGCAYFSAYRQYMFIITTPGVEPTNNLAEQAIRFVVIDRRITQGTRSEIGRQWNERIWTTIATLTQQGQSIFAYLRNAFHAYLPNQPTPALLPAGP